MIIYFSFNSNKLNIINFHLHHEGTLSPALGLASSGLLPPLLGRAPLLPPPGLYVPTASHPHMHSHPLIPHLHRSVYNYYYILVGRYIAFFLPETLVFQENVYVIFNITPFM